MQYERSENNRSVLKDTTKTFEAEQEKTEDIKDTQWKEGYQTNMEKHGATEKVRKGDWLVTQSEVVVWLTAQIPRLS